MDAMGKRKQQGREAAASGRNPINTKKSFVSIKLRVGQVSKGKQEGAWCLWEQQMAKVLMNRRVANVLKRQQRGQTGQNRGRRSDR